MTVIPECGAIWPGCSRDDCGWPNQECVVNEAEAQVLARSSREEDGPVGDEGRARASAFVDVPDACHCPGYPCEHVPPPTIWVADQVGYKLAYTRPVTLEMARQLRQAGLWATADLAEKYAVDRPRWWHRFWPVEGK